MRLSALTSVMVIVLCCVLCLSCGVAVRQAAAGYEGVRYSSLFRTGRRGPLRPVEREWAKTAWRYFQNNTESATGLPGGLDKNPVASAWNIGDYLAALNAVRELGIISDSEFLDRAVRVIQFLNSMPLYDHRLPNLFYNVQSGAMVTAANAPQELGWSAVDLGRLLIWLRVTGQKAPALAEYIDKAILRWSFCDVVSADGGLYAGHKTGGKTVLVQEGHLGYEEYAAFGFQTWGFDTSQASRLEPFSKAQIEGIDVLYDALDPRISKVYAPVVTLPHVLIGIEFNWDPIDGVQAPKQRPLADLAQSIYDVQEARYVNEHILTARTDHSLGRPPNFVYDTVFLAGYPWNTLTTDGTFAPEEALVSTGAAFGMWVLWKTSYTQTLMQSTQMLQDPKRGWFEGRFEKTGGAESTLSSTTNAVVLEALLYKKTGKVFRPSSAGAYYSLALQSEFNGLQTCLPRKR